MKSVTSSTSSLIDRIATSEGLGRQVILAKAQLAVGSVVKFQGEKKGRSDYAVGLVTLVASSQNTSIKHHCQSARGTKFLTVSCATKSKCEVRYPSYHRYHILTLTSLLWKQRVWRTATKLLKVCWNTHVHALVAEECEDVVVKFP